MSSRARLSIFAILLILCGCSARRGTGNAAPGTHPATDSVAYSLTLLPGSPPRVRVTLRVLGEPSGSSHLCAAASWGGIDSCERFVHDLTVKNTAGQTLPLTKDPNSSHEWIVSHDPGTTLLASYELRAADPDPLSDFGTHYEPVVRTDLLHLIGETGLIYPRWLDDRGPVDIDFSADGFAQQGWTFVSSFGAETHLHRSLADFRHAMFFAGKIRVHDRQIRGGKVRVALYGDWEFEDAELVDLIDTIIIDEREFARDFSDPYFLVTVVPTGHRVTAQSFSMGGTGLSNCFALFLAPGTSIAPGSPHRNQVLRTLAHEYFHTWNGGKIAVEDPEQLAYWFSEGFTDFYASRLLRRAGLIDDAEWTARMNGCLKKLWLSPVATEPNETIRRDFWNRREVEDLPYHRGEVIALVLDEEIRRASKGAKSLDDFFRELLADARRGEKAETSRLLARVSRWTSPQVAESLRKCVVDGALPDPPTRVTDPAAERADLDSHFYDPGFDLEASLKSKVVQGVRDPSAAFAAGLRDNQRISHFNTFDADPDREIAITVVENGTERSITFFPRGASVRIPAYRLSPSKR